ncbi:hypothetical protein ASF82_01720 [Frigoribacterium sp. Leaf164]|uniref:hypothetical protein n=1 Tax=unclassified Frigoribacterium TaxID=2627005 RepID=UPI0006FE143C|nr:MULTISPECIES: hypothetical protein [unclassified Frigoribacterium]KQR46271.1 hypothetical protein ASF82_01720 [Frigoribacterium sp. Leaf164]MBD8728449.1 hypothetical protein [Frigoribacterium sp. CFBP 13707]QNE44529.1 hypothetical protein F1C15_12510 [Frigoribacterium sp. NBH87]
MRWSRNRGADDGVDPAPVDPVALERAVGEGLLIARAAAVVSVANRIVVRALRDDDVFDRDETAEAVGRTLHRLAEEQRYQNKRIEAARAKTKGSRGRSRHQHDYRSADDATLWFRENTYVAVADRLDALRSDRDYVDGIVASAVERAWADVGSAVVTRVRAAGAVDPAYEAERDERLAGLGDDLAALGEARRSPDDRG